MKPKQIFFLFFIMGWLLLTLSCPDSGVSTDDGLPAVSTGTDSGPARPDEPPPDPSGGETPPSGESPASGETPDPDPFPGSGTDPEPPLPPDPDPPNPPNPPDPDPQNPGVSEIPLSGSDVGEIIMQRPDGFTVSFSFEQKPEAFESTPIVFEWFFGDEALPLPKEGSFSGEAGGAVTHRYTAPGQYTVTLCIDRALPERVKRFTKTLSLAMNTNPFKNLPDGEEVYVAFRFFGNVDPSAGGFKQTSRTGEDSYCTEIYFQLGVGNDAHYLHFGKDYLTQYGASGFDPLTGFTDSTGRYLSVPVYITDKELFKVSKESPVLSVANLLGWDITATGIFGDPTFDHPVFFRTNSIDVPVPMDQYNPALHRNIAKFSVECTPSNHDTPCSFAFEGFEARE